MGQAPIPEQALFAIHPFTAERGQAKLHVSHVHDRSTVVSACARNPLRLLTPTARGHAVVAFTSSFGGGMVGGDQTRLDLTVDANASCFLSTQASTKIYRNPEQAPCSHHLSAVIGAKGTLVLAPDPVQCFAGSAYEQRQDFALSPTANLVVVDWMTAGRTARGERWAFDRYASHNEVHRDRLLLLDRVVMDGRDGAFSNAMRGGRFNCVATVVVLGPAFQQHAFRVLSSLGSKPIAARDSLVYSISPLYEGVILRIASVEVERAGCFIREQIDFVSELLQYDPWARKW